MKRRYMVGAACGLVLMTVVMAGCAGTVSWGHPDPETTNQIAQAAPAVGGAIGGAVAGPTGAAAGIAIGTAVKAVIGAFGVGGVGAWAARRAVHVAADQSWDEAVEKSR